MSILSTVISYIVFWIFLKKFDDKICRPIESFINKFRYKKIIKGVVLISSAFIWLSMEGYAGLNDILWGIIFGMILAAGTTFLNVFKN
ncbi:hypothetical protein [Clostridium sp. UBA4548]|uniref:hypothetical protein n=1 Tax=Clostridium sp. UBA4548 TaxID=1946361 RepID=UPI0025BF7787|nr:hypothetical protein [Clostridium sp. UBA4548]